MNLARSLLLAATLAVVAGQAWTAASVAPDIVVTDAWSRATPPGTTVGVGYLTLRNAGPAPRRLVALASPAAAKVELHESRRSPDGLTQMRRVEALVLAPGQSLRLEPNGHHLMLVDLKTPLVAGAKVPVTLRFDSGAPVEVMLAVQPLTAMGPPASHGHGAHSH